jgi:hypothetical protein
MANVGRLTRDEEFEYWSHILGHTDVGRTTAWLLRFNDADKELGDQCHDSVGRSHFRNNDEGLRPLRLSDGRLNHGLRGK